MAVKKGLRIPQVELRQTMEYLKELERRKIIRRLESMWRTPIRVIQKEDGRLRIVSKWL